MRVAERETFIHIQGHKSKVLVKNYVNKLPTIGNMQKDVLYTDRQLSANKIQRTMLRGRFGVAFGVMSLGMAGIGAFVFSHGGKEVLEKHIEAKKEKEI